MYMSASELLREVGEQLRKLPTEERERFFEGMVSLEDALPHGNGEGAVRPLAWPDIQARHQRIFGDTLLPENVVLAGREEEDP
jgi:hypothetical protein